MKKLPENLSTEADDLYARMDEERNDVWAQPIQAPPPQPEKRPRPKKPLDTRKPPR